MALQEPPFSSSPSPLPPSFPLLLFLPKLLFLRHRRQQCHFKVFCHGAFSVHAACRLQKSFHRPPPTRVLHGDSRRVWFLSLHGVGLFIQNVCHVPAFTACFLSSALELPTPSSDRGLSREDSTEVIFSQKNTTEAATPSVPRYLHTR